MANSDATTPAYPVVEKNPKIVEATYNYGSRGLVTQHSIDDLACSLEFD